MLLEPSAEDLWATRPNAGAAAEPAFIEALHEKQKAFVLDPSKRKCALAGRRGGKSEGGAAWMIHGWERYPNVHAPIIAITKGHARKIFWGTFARLQREYSLPYVMREDIGELHFPNGYRIWLTGADNAAEIEKLRGPKYRRVLIDEPGSLPTPRLQYMVDDILDPALMDLDGELALTGTPGLVPAGYFFERTTDHGTLAQWPTHVWNCTHNPYVRGADYLTQKRLDNGWQEDHPTYVREYLGRWVTDEDALVYSYIGARNAFSELPTTPGDRWTYILSVDIGWHDATAFTLTASRRGHPEVYVLAAWKAQHQVTPQIAAAIERVRHKPPRDEAGRELDLPQYRLSQIVVDTGGGAKTVAEDMIRTYGIPCVAAEKREKQTWIHNVRGKLLAGTLLVHPWRCAQLLEEWAVLPWNDAKGDHHENFLDDCADSLLYGVRHHSLTYKPEREVPQPGDPEFVDYEQAEHKRRVLERNAKAQKKRDRKLVRWR